MGEPHESEPIGQQWLPSVASLACGATIVLRQAVAVVRWRVGYNLWKSSLFPFKPWWLFAIEALQDSCINLLNFSLHLATTEQLSNDLQQLKELVGTMEPVPATEDASDTMDAINAAAAKLQARWGPFLAVHFMIEVSLFLGSLLEVVITTQSPVKSGIQAMAHVSLFGESLCGAMEIFFCLLLQIIPITAYNDSLEDVAEKTKHFILHRAIKDLQNLQVHIDFKFSRVTMNTKMFIGLAMSLLALAGSTAFS